MAKSRKHIKILTWDVMEIAHRLMADFIEPENAPDVIWNIYAKDKWRELAKYYHQAFRNRGYQNTAELLQLLKSHGHKVKECGSQIYATVGHIYSINKHKFGTGVDVTSTILNETVILRINNQNLVTMLEEFSSMLPKLQDIIDEAIFKGKQMMQIAEISVPYIKEKLKSSAVMRDCEFDVNNDAELISLHIKPKNYPYEFYLSVTAEDTDELIRLMPTALSDLENIDFYFNRFQIYRMPDMSAEIWQRKQGSLQMKKK